MGKLWTKNYLAICSSNFFLYMTFYSILSTLPLFIEKYLNLGNEQVGIVISIFFIAYVITRPLAGHCLDRFSKRNTLLAGAVSFMLTSILYFFVHSNLFLIVLRFTQGITFAIATTAAATIVADVLPERLRGKGVGYFDVLPVAIHSPKQTESARTEIICSIRGLSPYL